MSHADQVLWAELREGKESAFKQLFDLYGNGMYNLALGICGNRSDAEDIVQDSFAEVFRSVASFRGEAQLSTWIYRITLNKALEGERRKKRKKRAAKWVSLFGLGKREEIHSIHWEHPGIVAENNELAQLLAQALEKLPENQRAAFTLHKLEGMEYREIAEILNVSLGSVESLMHRAKTNLQKHLSHYYKNR